MKAGIFTTRSVDPMHPRLAAFFEFFRDNGVTCEVIPQVRHPLFSRLNWLSLFFFDNWSVLKNRKRIPDYDIIIINDLRMLPLAKYAKKHCKPVIYDTIDNNVELRAYSLQKKVPFTSHFTGTIKNHFTLTEKKIAKNFCNTVIVNSKALVNYFGGQAELIYYYSELEKINTVNDPRKKPALIYLGAFSADKGAGDALELRKNLDIELFIFGPAAVPESELMQPGVHHVPGISQKELLTQIEKLMRSYFLAGLSLIRPVHQSYATQEANKDIDYLASGIPIIGNHRLPTEEKINAGCGIFIENILSLGRLIADEQFRKELTGECREYYKKNYSRERFRKGLDNVFGKYLA